MLQEALAMFQIGLFFFLRTKRIFQAFRVKIFLVGIKAKLFIIKIWFLRMVFVFTFDAFSAYLA